MSEREPGGSDGSPPAGWYRDPAGAGRLRYWDGTAWTHHVADRTASPGSGFQTPTRSSRFAWWQILLMVLGIGFGLLLLAFGLCVAAFVTMGY